MRKMADYPGIRQILSPHCGRLSGPHRGTRYIVVSGSSKVHPSLRLSTEQGCRPERASNTVVLRKEQLRIFTDSNGNKAYMVPVSAGCRDARNRLEFLNYFLE